LTALATIITCKQELFDLKIMTKYAIDLGIVMRILQAKKVFLATLVGLWSGWIFSVLIFAIVIGFVVLFTTDVPAVGFAAPPLLDAIVVAVQILIALAVTMFICAVRQWVRPTWGLVHRAYYMLLTVVAIGVVADLIFWNLTKWPS
jgi:hypothetical protein